MLHFTIKYNYASYYNEDVTVFIDYLDIMPNFDINTAICSRIHVI